MSKKRAVAVEDFNKSKITFYYDEKYHGKEGRIFDIENSTEYDWQKFIKNIKNKDDIHLEANCKLKEVEFDKSFKNFSSLESTKGMFDGCHNLKKIVGLEYLDTSNVKDMSFMFAYCRALKKIDVSSFDVGKVICIDSMFEGCLSLEKMDLSSWDVSGVLDMNYLFEGCYNLKQVDVSGWCPNRLLSNKDMFFNCDSLTTIKRNTGNNVKVALENSVSSVNRLNMSKSYVSKEQER